MEDHIRKLTEQITWIIFRLIDQPKFKIQLSFYCHFEEIYDEGVYERENNHISSGMKRINTQIVLVSSINEINSELETRIENLQKDLDW